MWWPKRPFWCFTGDWGWEVLNLKSNSNIRLKMIKIRRPYARKYWYKGGPGLQQQDHGKLCECLGAEWKEEWEKEIYRSKQLWRLLCNIHKFWFLHESHFLTLEHIDWVCGLLLSNEDKIQLFLLLLLWSLKHHSQQVYIHSALADED